jgi:RimJ/RimL family protein N-acetyltransferase
LPVRLATSADATAIAEAFARVAEEGSLATEPPVDVAERAERFRERIESEGPEGWWVLEDGAEIVGGASVGETVPGVLSLGMMVVAEARGRGGGRALLNAVIEHARAVGAHKIELEVWPDNGRAIALYASAGFGVEGLKRHHYRRRDGTLRSALLMGLLLDEGAG